MLSTQAPPSTGRHPATEGVIVLGDASIDADALASMLARATDGTVVRGSAAVARALAASRPGMIVVRSWRRRNVQALVRDARCPVAVAPHGFGGEPPGVLRRIGVAFDGWSESRSALAEASRLAEGAGAELVLLMVGDPHTAASTEVGDEEQDWLLGHSEAAARYLEPVVAELSRNVRTHGAVLYGQVVPALRAAAGEHGLDMIVLGSRRQGPIAQVVLGSVSAALLHDPPCPLLVCPRGAR
ncbi:MAG: universal stress protein [Thermoleophilaceae bacterium]|nr:universal stress protein [Thermoleophilaceae bacterium]